MLELFQELGTVTAACEGAGVSRQAHYNWLRDDADYKARFQALEDQCAVLLEDEARKRALAGSDTLLIFLLKGARPEKYRERSEVKHDLSGLSNAELIERAKAAGIRVDTPGSKPEPPAVA